MLGGEAEALQGKTKRHIKYFYKSNGKPFVVQSVSCPLISISPSIPLEFKLWSFGSVHGYPIKDYFPDTFPYRLVQVTRF